MRRIIQIWKVKKPANEKEAEIELKQYRAGCDFCDDVIMDSKGVASCVHNDYYTYFYQCPKCKTIELFDANPEHFDSGLEERWSLVESGGNSVPRT